MLPPRMSNCQEGKFFHSMMCALKKRSIHLMITSKHSDRCSANKANSAKSKWIQNLTDTDVE